MDNRHEKAEFDFFITALKEEARTMLWEVGSSADPGELVEGILGELEALAPRQADLENRTEEQIWSEVRQRLLKAAYATRPFCIRCGTCCSKGSPTLLKQDFSLLQHDVIKPVDLMTIRRGEPAYSSRSEQTAPAETELIKVREVPGARSCIFYHGWDKSCSIYESRPTQCQLQECWNAGFPEEMEAEPLTRKDLLSTIDSLWQVIERHEERCSHQDLSRAVTRLAATKGQTVQEVLDLLAFDHHVREFMRDTVGLDAEAMDLFFGRPLEETLFAYGLRLEQQPDGAFLLTILEEE